MNDPVVLTQMVGFAMFLWLGTYLLLRSGQRSVLTLVSVGGLLAQAVFWAVSVFSYTATSPTTLVWLDRVFWWSSVLPMAAWFHFCSLAVRRLTRQRNNQRDRLIVLAVYAVALVLIVLGSTTNLITNFSAPPQRTDRYLDLQAGGAYGLHLGYIGVVGATALAYLVRAWRSVAHAEQAEARAIRAQLQLLLSGAVLFLLGALGVAFAAFFNVRALLAQLPAYVCLLAGLGAVGYGIAQFSLLLEGQGIKRDFFYGLTGIALLNLLYVAVLVPTGAPAPGSVVALVGLVTLSHTLFDWGCSAWDKLFFNRDEQAARAEARDYAIVLGTDPVQAPFEPASPVFETEPEPELNQQSTAATDTLPTTTLDVPDPKAFCTLVRRAITGIKSSPQLAKSPLLSLELIDQRVQQSGQPNHRLNRVAALRDLLIEQIEALQPNHRQGSVVSDAWRFYNVLYYPYVRGTNRKSALAEARRLAQERQRSGQCEPSELEQALAWLADVEEDTFYKWQRRASDTIATLLWEENERAKQGQRDTVTR